MALRASATATPPLPPPPSSVSSRPRTFSLSKTTPPKPQFSNISLPTSTTLSLFALFNAPHQAQALALSKEQIVSSLTQVEETIDQTQGVVSNVLDAAGHVIGVVSDAVTPAVEVALPILKQIGGEAVKIATPAISEASRKVQEAIQSSGFDTQPVLNVAKVLICFDYQFCSFHLFRLTGGYWYAPHVFEI